MVALTPEGDLLASGGKDNNILIWGVESGFMQTALYGHIGNVRATCPTRYQQLKAGGIGCTCSVISMNH